jgi:hypothetical protein
MVVVVEEKEEEEEEEEKEEEEREARVVLRLVLRQVPRLAVWAVAVWACPGSTAQAVQGCY